MATQPIIKTVKKIILLLFLFPSLAFSITESERKKVCLKIESNRAKAGKRLLSHCLGNRFFSCNLGMEESLKDTTESVKTLTDIKEGYADYGKKKCLKNTSACSETLKIIIESIAKMTKSKQDSIKHIKEFIKLRDRPFEDRFGEKFSGEEAWAEDRKRKDKLQRQHRLLSWLDDDFFDAEDILYKEVKKLKKHCQLFFSKAHVERKKACQSLKSNREKALADLNKANADLNKANADLNKADAVWSKADTNIREAIAGQRTHNCKGWLFTAEAKQICQKLESYLSKAHELKSKAHELKSKVHELKNKADATWSKAHELKSKADADFKKHCEQVIYNGSSLKSGQLVGHYFL